ncbi:nucleotidyltransferase domain-containing protein [Patescibacteria group bacterium]|nr:nucleotidyltransferase domain-containing protein [Patescibacteria group bacterium]MBU4000311.1 nucleotidyltransferase domain-containing protein [Patescibacteria group bacterium]MBU4056922.1 nucleotidyltransferase domain-containing protein [Patescibacteria group bacterium]MBU4368448.1 nucleotidyltransferase domain-containing protein [Patescibacteria group bacterium]
MLEKHQKQLNEIFKENQVVLAYLFGSAARGKTTALSDIDIAVVFSDKAREKDYFKKELHLAHKIGNVFKIDRVDIVNLKTVKSPLLKHNAVFKGKLIFGKYGKKQFELESGIMKEYEDTKHLRAVQDYYLYKHIKAGTFGKGKLIQKSKYLEKYVANK